MKRYFLIFIGLTVSALFLLSACKEKLTSVVESAYDDGTPQKVLYYKTENGKKILVKSAEYYPNHQPYIEGGYKDGEREGEWKSWYDNGNLWSVGTFKAGVSVGETKTYHENGSLNYSGAYDENGKRTGTWKFYDKDSNLLETIDY